jgi:hypothetical protein
VGRKWRFMMIGVGTSGPGGRRRRKAGMRILMWDGGEGVFWYL